MTRLIACAIVRGDPPEVFAAEDLETLHWILALRVVAATPARELPAGIREALRDALLDERWGDAVAMWMGQRDAAVDVYPSMDLHTPSDVAMADIAMQFMPLFED
jgi:hypothetical protein